MAVSVFEGYPGLPSPDVLVGAGLPFHVCKVGKYGRSYPVNRLDEVYSVRVGLLGSCFAWIGSLYPGVG